MSTYFSGLIMGGLIGFITAFLLLFAWLNNYWGDRS